MKVPIKKTWDTTLQHKDVKSLIEKVCWCPPNFDYVKINFDGSFIQNRKSGAWALL
jgi:hypothetical protein